MKKLQLKLDGVKEMLTREQMKKIIGGSGSGSGGGNYKCCYTKTGGSTGCSSCYHYTTKPTCGTNSEGTQGVLTSC